MLPELFTGFCRRGLESCGIQLISGKSGAESLWLAQFVLATFPVG